MSAELEALALKAGARPLHDVAAGVTRDFAMNAKQLARFRALVLEEAAQVCDSAYNSADPMRAQGCADAIRALKGKS